MSVSIDAKRPSGLNTKLPTASAEFVCPNCGQPMGIRLIVADKNEELTTYVCVHCGGEKTVAAPPR